MKQKNKSSFINIGFSSIVMVFIMICLVTFATLSVLTAHSDYRLSQKMADKTTAYYKADAIARDMVELLDNQLFEIYLEGSSSDYFYETVAATDFSANAPSDIHNITLKDLDDDTILSYEVPISEVQTLHVSLQIRFPLAESECFTTITRWQTVTENAPDESDEYLNLYTGEE